MGTRVYIGRLNYDVRERDLEKFFKGYGRIREILLKNGFGFVEFDDYRDADDAVYELNGKELLGERVNVQHARGGGPRSGGGPRGSGGRGWGGGGGGYGRSSRSSSNRDSGKDKRYGPPTRTDHRLIVENLSSRVSWQDLKDYMRQAGEVTYADAHKQHRNEGVVEFASHSDLKTAIDKLNGTELNGRKIKLFEDKSHRRSRSRSHSRGRSSSSRSRTKSRSRSARRSKSAQRSRSASRSRSRSRSPRDRKNNDSSRRTKSKSPAPRGGKNNAANSRSRSKSRSHSKAKSDSKSRSRSKSPADMNGDNRRGGSSDKEAMDDKKDD